MKAVWQAIKNYFRRLDKVLLLLSAAAAAFSLVLLYSEVQAGFWISAGSRCSCWQERWASRH